MLSDRTNRDPFKSVNRDPESNWTEISEPTEAGAEVQEDSHKDAEKMQHMDNTEKNAVQTSSKRSKFRSRRRHEKSHEGKPPSVKQKFQPLQKGCYLGTCYYYPADGRSHTGCD